MDPPTKHTPRDHLKDVFIPFEIPLPRFPYTTASHTHTHHSSLVSQVHSLTPRGVLYCCTEPDAATFSWEEYTEA